MDKVQERLKEIAERRKEIADLVEKAEDEEQLEELEGELEKLQDEQMKLRKEKAKTTVERFKNAQPKENPEENTDEDGNHDPYGTMEYRKMFRDYVTKQDKRILKYRDNGDEVTMIDDVGAIIPTTIMDRVVSKLEDHGEIFALITRTNIKGGVEVPVGGTKPTASWTSEGSVANKQEQEIDDKVTFSYHKLQIRVARTLEAATVSLDLWESHVAENIAEAMIMAIEEAIIKGTGSGQPEGVLEAPTSVIPSEQRVDFKKDDADYKGWITKLWSNIPTAYRKRRTGVILVNPATFDKYMWGLVDENGQPVARVTHGLTSGPEYRFMGKRVILTDYVESIDEASDEDVVAIYGDLSNYLLNTNLQIRQRQYFDEDTDEYIQKSTMIVDGKLVDGYGFVLLKYDDDNNND